MNLNFAAGFPNQGAVTKMFLDIKDVLKIATDDMAGNRPKNIQLFERWFGAFNGDFGNVRNVINKMHNAIFYGRINLTYNTRPDPCDGTTFAEALAPDEPESYHKVATAVDHDLCICRELFTLPRNMPRIAQGADFNQYMRNVPDTQLGSIMHEFSHLVGGTDDVALNSGAKAYGAASALSLVGQAPVSRCRNNACNYEYYLLSITQSFQYKYRGSF